LNLNIVIPVFNRPHSLARLLRSFDSAHFFGIVNIYISCEANSSSSVLKLAEAFEWKHGIKTIIKRDSQLGADAHNLACMAMAKELGHILVIEDDLVVSPYFLQYLEACEDIFSEHLLAGVSLYRYPIIEMGHFPFSLVPNDEFTYYQQRPSSKGCFYTWDMIEPYFDFLKSFKYDFENYSLPANVQNWSDEVWEKSFYCYMIENNKFIAFPRFSLSTDFADAGVHMKKQTLKYVHQSPLFLSDNFNVIKKINDTLNVYDSFYELLPNKVKSINKLLSDFDFEMDLYGNKKLQNIKSEFLLSSKKCVKPKLGWERRLKPEINNILLDQIGLFFTLANKNHFKEDTRFEEQKERFLYYYPDTKLLDLIRMKLAEIFARFL